MKSQTTLVGLLLFTVSITIIFLATCSCMATERAEIVWIDSLEFSVWGADANGKVTSNSTGATHRSESDGYGGMITLGMNFGTQAEAQLALVRAADALERMGKGIGR